MNRILTFLWIIIIVCTVFIAINLTKPDIGNENYYYEYQNGQVSIPSDGESPDSQYSVPKSTPKNTPPISDDTEIKQTTTVIAPRVEIPKTYVEAVKNGDLAMNEGNTADAIEFYSYAVNLNPVADEPYLKLGEAYLKNNEADKAVTVYKKAVNINSGSIDNQLKLVQAYINNREFEKAKTLVSSLDQNNFQTMYYQGIILLIFDDPEGAKNLFTNIVNAQQLDNNELKENAQMFLDAHQHYYFFREAEQVFYQTLIAKALTDVSQYEAAIAILFRTIEEKSNYRDAWIVLGYAYLNTNKITDAIDALDKARNLDPEKPETLFFLGLAHFANSDLEKAAIFLEKADEYGFEPKDQIYMKLGDIYMLLKEYEKSENYYSRVLSLNTSSMEIFIRSIWLNIDKLNNPEKALTLANNALETYPNQAMSYNLIGWAMIAKTDYPNAKIYLDKALQLDPRFDAAHLNMGWLYEKQNNQQMAKEYYKKAYTLGKGNSIANLAAVRFNNLTEQELKKYYTKVDIASPTSIQVTSPNNTTNP